ncbi:MAG: hypothetical protein H6551_04575 [Chitinophagales bacterium]|nr:hypothetical protein [Chitinophagaceae bacterium]MCB9064400.1 hypothetical protein [Chitinophagales bacterium]
MEDTNTLETLLWLLVALIGSGMTAVLVVGWLKGANWQREMKMKRRQ